MAIREEIVASAVTFLQDPSVTGSPLENRIAFLQSKNLTQEEVDAALARAGGESPPNYPNYAPRQVARQQPAYGNHQQYSWQQAPSPPDIPKRDWRDWFIMATVMGGVSYGLYFVAKRYVYPMIAPPTTPQLVQDKQAIDESFEKAFGLLDQLAKDTDALKVSEEARTERLDAALTEVESVIGELKSASKDREQESRRINDEVRGLKDLIPRAMDCQKEATEIRLKELNVELKSLKTLLGQRMNPTAPATSNSYSKYGVAGGSTTVEPNVNGGLSSDAPTPKPASVSGGSGTETTASLQGRATSPFNASGHPLGSKPAIPAWQLAAANKTATPSNADGSNTDEA
ncbi:peroxisomal membrane anchor protein conserved region-domain-containing protein [Calycina marina]|uniref:Peroxisomal membrane protein PEX14 n=1 Tax=Calycina marina TaxID=1763456 RepID=A0A9P8CKN3_9HELO|nr:peroxisomal membrane anchor protein conserved region-domain-containing protein [Calycina marina]